MSDTYNEAPTDSSICAHSRHSQAELANKLFMQILLMWRGWIRCQGVAGVILVMEETRHCSALCSMARSGRAVVINII